MTKDITAIILAGGKSSRMGTDKCFLKLGEKTLIELVISNISAITKSIIISATNPEKFEHLNLPIVIDVYKNIGPLAGIHSALSNSQTEINILAACDTPFISAEVYEYLLKRLPDYDAVVPIYENRFYPISAVILRKILPTVRQQISRRDYKVLNLFRRLNTCYVTLPSELIGDYTFFNINTRAEYARAQKFINHQKIF